MVEYKMVQLPPNIRLQTSTQRGNEAAEYLQTVANKHAADGWEFFRIDTIGVTVPPGCLMGLLGQSSTTRNVTVQAV